MGEIHLGQEEVKTPPFKTQSIWQWTSRQKKNEIECFLEWWNLYQQFMEGLTRTARPVYAKTKKECIGKREWGVEEQHAFDQQRPKLTTASGVVYLDPLEPTKMEKTTLRNTSPPVYYHNKARMENGDQGHTDPRQIHMSNATTTCTTRDY